ncbi:uncharacterized protein PITG_02632 [Phytophthora infestans T30-4]|uniref:Uncharacterized protein n=1 Tax=Phytophthora infestans (strain T30-4) TaxID=403677 RepID=D0MWU1_PHYIT|nr:uncharacterized protein PITG_02632 [Phytophthora infestans T30-4]EEY64104.1 hypothetical protein PITG_02632 [Phytophthora infestans T30-4]|eukprot:XP_002907540.1 hypothetical protein PITG_02632 [Phytophthora infestans T30-4]
MTRAKAAVTTKPIPLLGHPHGTVHGWWVGRTKLRVYGGNKLDKTTKGQGRKESFPFTSALLTYTKDVHRDEKE